MPSIRSILLLGLPLVVFGQDYSQDPTIEGKWEEVVESLPGESLKAALQGNIYQYREGVFEDGRNAIDAVRSDDPELAAALVDLAKQDAVVKDHLRKRQGTSANSTIPSSTASSTPSTSVSVISTAILTTIPSTTPSSTPATSRQDSTTPTPTSTPIEPATTTPQPTTTPRTTAPAPTTTQRTTPSSRASTTPAPTTSSSSPTSATNVVIGSDGSIITSVPPLFTATVSDGNIVVLTSPTPGDTYTGSDNGGGVVIVTYTPGGGTVSQIRYKTTKLSNGLTSTITSFATAGAPNPTSDSSNSQQSDDATLQNGAAGPAVWYPAVIALVLGGAIGVASVVL